MISDLPLHKDIFFLHKHDSSILIYVIIHVEKTFKAIHFEKRYNRFQVKLKVTDHLQQKQFKI